MPSSDFDTLAAAKDLQAAGIDRAHAEAIVTTVNEAKASLLTESRFESEMQDVRKEFRATNARFESEMQAMREEFRATNARFEKAMEAMRDEFRAESRENRAYIDQRLAEQTAALEVGLARQAAALAEFKGEIYRYLWFQGGSIVVILSTLYMLAETWFRG